MIIVLGVFKGMELNSIISEICGEADDFLAGVTKPTEARAGIAELLTIRYGGLSAADKTTVTDQVMRILNQENFFTHAAGGED